MPPSRPVATSSGGTPSHELTIGPSRVCAAASAGKRRRAAPREPRRRATGEGRRARPCALHHARAIRQGTRRREATLQNVGGNAQQLARTRNSIGRCSFASLRRSDCSALPRRSTPSRAAATSRSAALSAAAGPVGRTAGTSVMPLAAVHTYSRSQGVFCRHVDRRTVIAGRDDANHAYYGRG